MSALENIKNKTEQSVFSLVELLVLARFTLVGILAAAVHISIAWILISISALPPIMANLLAWSVAFMISFAGHYYWTFQARCNRNQALRGFFSHLSISLSGK
jgi:putative flippase GtrA